MGNNIDWRKVSIVPAKPRLSHAVRNDIVGMFHREILQYDSVMMDWLNASPENRQAYVDDPLGCFRRVAKPAESTLQIVDRINQLPPQEVLAALSAQPPAYAGAVSYPDDASAQDSACAEPCLDDAPAQDPAGAAPCLGENLDIHGWDIVTSMRFTKLNALLQYAMDHGVLPTRLEGDVEIKVAWLLIKFHVGCDIGTPRVTGGGTDRLDLFFPVRNVTVRREGEAGMEFPQPDGAGIHLEVSLEAVTSARAGGGNEYVFYMTFTDGFIHLATGVNLSKELLDLMGGEGQVALILKNLLVRAVEGHSRVEVCRVNPADIKQEYRFLVPSKAQYVATFKSAWKDGFLSILMLTTSQSEERRELDDDLIDKDCDGSVLISSPLFLENVVKKAMVSSCNIGADNVQCRRIEDRAGKPWQLQNAHGFDFRKIEGYTPHVKTLSLGAYGDQFHLNMTADVVPVDGITFHYWAKGDYAPYFTDKQEFKIDQKYYSSDHETEVEWWVYTIAALAAVVALWMYGAIIGVMVAGLSFGTIGIVEAIMDNIAPPGVESSVFTGAIKDVRWSHGDIITFKGIRIATNILIGFTLPFAK